MEVDTGASVSIMPENVYHKLWARQDLKQTTIKLFKETYPSIWYYICEGGQGATLPPVIIKGEGPTLLGRKWLTQIKFDWPKGLSSGWNIQPPLWQ